MCTLTIFNSTLKVFLHLLSFILARPGSLQSFGCDVYTKTHICNYSISKLKITQLFNRQRKNFTKKVAKFFNTDNRKIKDANDKNKGEGRKNKDKTQKNSSKPASPALSRANSGADITRGGIRYEDTLTYADVYPHQKKIALSEMCICIIVIRTHRVEDHPCILAEIHWTRGKVNLWFLHL